MPVIYFSGFVTSEPPPDIRPYVDDYQWQMIRQKVTSIEGFAHSATCCCEIILCLTIAGPFIFLCHPCVYGLCAACRKPRDLEQLNNMLFGGSPVLGWSDVRYTFNTDIAQPRASPAGPHMVASSHGGAVGYAHTAIVTQQPQSPSYTIVSVQPVGDTNFGAGATYAQPPVATPVGGQKYEKLSSSSNARQMMVTIPPNATAGNVLTVAAPNGTLLQVPVQAHHRPGENIVVEY